MYNLLLTILLVLSVVIVMYLMPAQVICLNAVKHAVSKL